MQTERKIWFMTKEGILWLMIWVWLIFGGMGIWTYALKSTWDIVTADDWNHLVHKANMWLSDQFCSISDQDIWVMWPWEWYKVIKKNASGANWFKCKRWDLWKWSPWYSDWSNKIYFDSIWINADDDWWEMEVWWSFNVNDITITDPFTNTNISSKYAYWAHHNVVTDRMTYWYESIDCSCE